ncbi:MAG: VOC family protein [Bacteroidota bacterium]|nr:VOC family protein [Bacteroidota bacterium]
MHIDHIAIWTTDLEKEKDFFLKYFNCTAGKMYSNPRKHFSSCFISFADGSRIELMKRNDIGTRYEGESLGYAHIAIKAGSREKVEKLTERLEKDGFTIKSKPRQTGDGYYESVILDPENNIIEITC